ncbi:MAG TPA: hypothetical protein VFM27_08790 [Acidimicrobiales bacterium]|nr:hypothetical protein [Acidimicrobiales bacterium]
MQPADDGGSARSDQLRRYGPVAIIVVLLVVIAGIVVVAGGGGDDDTAGESGTSGGSEWTSVEGREPGAPEPTGEMPVTYAEAEEHGTLDDHTWSDTCDTDRGTITVPSVYAPPCVPAFEGDNGGATSPGVTADAIKVVFYAPEENNDLNAILGGMGVNDTAEQRVETLQNYLQIFSSVGESYGREIELVRFAGTGAADDVVASAADAADIIAMEPFAVIGGPGLDRGTFAQEIADAGILCYGCGSYLPDQMILDMAPYVWDTAPSPNQFLGLLNAWTSAALEAGDSTAAFAGGELEGKERKVGIIHFEQDPPIYGQTEEEQRERFGEDAYAFNEPYILDLPNMPAKAAELIAKYKSEGVTTIVFLGDPFMPGYLTTAATEQDYHPEWIFTGTALTDTNVLARTWDQEQMTRAYGISQLAAPTEQDLQEAMTIYRWYYGEDAMPPAQSQYALLAPPVAWLVAGIHMAGPELTPETFARGLFRMPPRGGGPSRPQVSYGNWGMFPEMDYQGIDDAVEIWWDTTVEAEDERGAIGSGVWRRSNGGDRFTIDEAPAPSPFSNPEDALTVVTSLPPEDTAPSYPPPPGSPAASS